ncbi:filamentous haemagglutinin family protein [Isoalcanivorax beigongshangi]|uniref:Filamentous hemagglutinin family protein n=1 Tax=Isoalcanivorax beigongshangi TaxID=3238810 RepID=A0ABV4ADF2_9GAMM
MAARTLFPRTLRVSRTHRFLLRPLAQAVALAMLSQGALAAMPGWMHGGTAPPSQGGSAGAGYPGGLPPGTGVPRPPMPTPDAQLRESMRNLGNTLSNIAAAQARHAASRRAAYDSAIDIPDGLGEGGLQIDRSLPFEEAWRNAKAPVQTIKDGRTEVTITQTDDKAILNWETFNVGRDTTVNFEQERDWAVLNRVNDAQSRPSQILGQVKGDGTVMIVNRNGVIFTGTSQVNVRNLVAAATQISDEQFSERGIYASESNNQYTPSFTAAGGKVVVEAGAEITTHKAEKATEAGGYVMLLGREVHNAGRIVTANGQVTLAAGDEFVIRRGYSTDSNPGSSTRGNEVGVRRAAGSDSGLVTNSGILQASTGDITLAGHQLRQDGVIVSSTSVDNRGTVHLLNSARDNEGSITFGKDSVTAILVEDSDVTGLDAQKDAGLTNLVGQGPNQVNNTGDFDLYSGARTHGALSRVEVVSGGEVNFEGGSTTLATGGHITVDAPRTQIRDGAVLDVSGATGVVVSMESNSIRINVQGFEQRESPVNRDEKNLNSKRVWIDLRDLIFVPSGTNGYDGDRWYTAGGLLEVGGHVANLGRGIGEWLSQGGSLRVSGKDLVTEQGSRINLSGGTLQVQTGYVYKSYVKGADGKLYDVATAPGDVLYTGLYQGFERRSERWGHTDYYWNPMVASQRVLENGYTIGRDAGQMMVGTETASLAGDLIGEVYQGDRQIRRGQAGLESFYQSQNAIARGAELIIGKLEQFYDKSSGRLVDRFSAVTDQVTLGGDARDSGIHLNGDWLDAQGLSRLRVAGLDSVSVEQKVSVADGGSIQLLSPHVRINADLVARSGRIEAGNISRQPTVLNDTVTMGDHLLRARGENPVGIEVAENVVLDASGRWVVLSTGGDTKQLAYRDGGDVLLRSSGDTKLADGSLITVSSGGGFGENGKRLGGRGGNVTFGHIELGGDLELNGEIEGYGVDGGGTLTLISSRGVVISDDDSAGAEGIIEAGEEIGTGFRLQRDITVEVKEGQRLPFEVTLQRTHVDGGQVVPVRVNYDVSPAKPLVLAESWTVPPRGTPGMGTNAIFALGGTSGSVRPGDVIPAGSTITNRSGLVALLGVGARIPANVFPSGIPVLAPYSQVVPAGSMLSASMVAALGGVATAAAGTLLKAGEIASVDFAVQAQQRLGTDQFSKGFSHYQVGGRDGLTVAAGTLLEVVMPVLRAAPGSSTADVWLPDQFTVNGDASALEQRAGAGLSLTTGATGSFNPTAQLRVDQGAELRVDDGQQIALTGDTVDIRGRIQAHSGSVDVAAANITELAGHGIVVRDGAVLDVSGRAWLEERSDRRLGWVGAGGRIRLGGDVDDATGRLNMLLPATNGQGAVVLESGASLKASGSEAEFDIEALGRTRRATDGGSISLASRRQLDLEGELLAASGGEGASGGRLSVAMGIATYPINQGAVWQMDEGLFRIRQIILTNTEAERPEAESGSASLSMEKVAAGEFDELTIHSEGGIQALGSLEMSLGRAIRLFAGGYGWASGVDAGAGHRWAVRAPYVMLGGISFPTEIANGAIAPSYQLNTGSNTPGLSKAAGDLVIKADHVDLAGHVALGNAPTAGNQIIVEREKAELKGFDAVSIRSSGDIRFLGFNAGNGQSSLRTAGFYTAGDIFLESQRVYPATHVQVTVVAGREGAVSVPGSSLEIKSVAGLLREQKPYSVFGSLNLSAEYIRQGGALYAPLGHVSMGGAHTSSVVLERGSLTSTSSAGLVMPYGGTVDGEVWWYGGVEKNPDALFGGSQNRVDIIGNHQQVEQDAIIDVSGGGELAGAGFLPGRGGSTDARLAPLIQIGTDGFRLPGLATNPVYALVPGYQSAYAPIDPEQGAGLPDVGRQVVIESGVPGLPAGVYTLMPSTYALLPGAFRIEFNGDALPGDRVQSLTNGSFSAPVLTQVAGTNIGDVAPRQALITSAANLRRYAGYNETSYSEYQLATALSDGVLRGRLPADGGTLRLNFNTGSDQGESLDYAGTLRAGAAEGGIGSTLEIVAARTGEMEIVQSGAGRSEDFVGASLSADSLMTLAEDMERLVIGGVLSGGGTVASGNLVNVTAQTGALHVRENVHLTGNELWLIAGGTGAGVNLEQGVVVDTLSGKRPVLDAASGVRFEVDGAALVVSNGVQRVDVKSGSSARLQIGEQARLYSQGSLRFVAASDVSLADSVRYGTRHLGLSLGHVNMGSAEALAEAQANGVLPDGFSFDQQTLERLLQGDTSSGAPALESFTLGASQGMNLFGDVTLSTYDSQGKSLLDVFMLSTPAILGAGGADDTFTLNTRHLAWDGGVAAAERPEQVVEGGAGNGSGRFVVNADVIEMGPGPDASQVSRDSRDRTLLGFAEVVLQARQRFTTGHTGTLKVYQSRGDYVEGEGYRYQGGNLRIETPRITGNAGADLSVMAGGDVLLTGLPTGVEAVEDKRDLTRDLGASLSFAGERVTLDTEVLLPTGKLALKGQGDVVLTDNAVIDVAGRTLQYRDQRQYTWGGDVELESEQGRITTAAGSSIDLSATNSQGGTLKVTALGEQDGHVDLRGRIRGAVSGEYDAAGTRLPYAGAEVTVRAQTLADFAELNWRLNDDQVFGARRFQLKQGDLVVSDEVKAREVRIALDNGRLTVDGKIDASGLLTGTIELFARNGLTVTGRGVLDAHGTRLRVDSYGQIIDAVNRAQVLLSSGDGELVMEQGARVDLRHGVDAPRTGKGAHDGAERGTLTLIAPRRGADADGDVAVDIRGQVQVDGARRIDLLALRSYDDAPVDWDNADGDREQIINQAYLDQKHQDSTLFINAALRNDDLRARFAGLRDGREQAFHLRPAVEIRSDTDDGKLVVQGDLDLSRYRYASLNPNTPMTGDYGSGEAGALTLRAGGDLEVLGSITDGFMAPPVSPDENGWFLRAGVDRYSTDVILQVADIVLAQGTAFRPGQTLNYDVPLAAFWMAAGGALGTEVILDAVATWPANTVLAADILLPDGTRYSAGTLLTDTLVLPAGSRLGAGSVLPVAVQVAAMTWPKGIALPFGSANAQAAPTNLAEYRVWRLETSHDLALKRGSLIPAGIDVKLPDGVEEFDLRSPVDGSQGRNWALAAMLPNGFESWDLSLVAGGDLDSVDPLVARRHGRLTLSDHHYQVARRLAETPRYLWQAGNGMGMAPGEDVAPEQLVECEANPGWCAQDLFAKRRLVVGLIPSVVRTGTGRLDLVAGGDVSMDSLYGVYTAGTPLPVAAVYNQPRAESELAGVAGGDYQHLVGGSQTPWQAWYPEYGGQLTVRAGGNLTGFMASPRYEVSAPRSVNYVKPGAWLWQQGIGEGGLEQPIPGAWWINYGTYIRQDEDVGASFHTDPLDRQTANRAPRFVGFTGVGTLGGGNLAVEVAGSIGVVAPRRNANSFVSQGIQFWVASSARDVAGEMLAAGGGDLRMRAGDINPLDVVSFYGVNPTTSSWAGSLGVLRGALQLQAGSSGYGRLADATLLSPSGWAVGLGQRPQRVSASGALDLVLGDAQASLAVQRDAWINTIADITRIGGTHLASTPSWFTSWSPGTGVTVLSAGGNAGLRFNAHLLNGGDSVNSAPKEGEIGTAAGVGNYYLPSRVDLFAGGESIFIGGAFSSGQRQQGKSQYFMPSEQASIRLLARDSIWGGGSSWLPIDTSIDALATIFRPAYAGNVSLGPGNWKNDLHAYGSYSTASDSDRAMPLWAYALDGYLTDFHVGSVRRDPGGRTLYAAGGPVHLYAGKDIIGVGQPDAVTNNEGGAYGLASHSRNDDVSTIEAGGRILSSSFRVAGPGRLNVLAGGSILLKDQGQFTSLGVVVPNDLRLGADIQMVAGLNQAPLAADALLDKYLDDQWLADPELPLADQPGYVVKSYRKEWAEFLRENAAFQGTDDEALAQLGLVAARLREDFARQIVLNELLLSGREFNDPDSRRVGSYLRGRRVIEMAYVDRPEPDGALSADVIMFGGSGIRTINGGDIHVHTPFGAQTYGVEGVDPPGTAGVITLGQGDIRLFSRDSILLGQSRIMTLLGGSIQAWSELGDINAGRGAQGTQLFTPPRRLYDQWGNVLLAPNAPSSGAGIATLSPVPGTEPGDVDLIAPLGTIDAGEAGIRVSGNVNIAALQVLNADNIEVQGEAKGLPVLAAVDVGALSAASAASSAAAQAAEAVNRQRERSQQQSLISVDVLGYGDEDLAPGGAPLSQAAPPPAVEVLGGPTLQAQALALLTAEEVSAMR